MLCSVSYHCRHLVSCTNTILMLSYIVRSGATRHQAGRTAICRWGAWLRRQPAGRVASEATPPPPASPQHRSVNTPYPIVLRDDAARNYSHEVSIIPTNCSQFKARNCSCSNDNIRKCTVITTSCHAPRSVMSTLKLGGDVCHACTCLAKANKR